MADTRKNVDHVETKAEAVSPTAVGNAFVKQYYHLLSETPEQLHRFYKDISTWCHGNGSQMEQSILGQKAINDQIMIRGYIGTRVDLDRGSIDCQASLHGSILVLVTGVMTLRSSAIPKPFVQTFYLAVQPTGYFVLNDVLRFLEAPSPSEAGTSASIPIPTRSPQAKLPATKGDRTPCEDKSRSDVKTPKKTPEAPKAVPKSPNVKSVEVPAKKEMMSPKVNAHVEKSDTKESDGVQHVQESVKEEHVQAPNSSSTSTTASPEKPAKAPVAQADTNESVPTQPKPSTNWAMHLFSSSTAPRSVAVAPTPKAVSAKPVTPPKPKPTSQPSDAAKKTTYSIYIREFPSQTQESDLRELFEPFGKIVSINHASSRGFAFVDYLEHESVKKVLNESTSFELYGKVLYVDERGDRGERKESRGSYRSDGRGGRGRAGRDNGKGMRSNAKRNGGDRENSNGILPNASSGPTSAGRSDRREKGGRRIARERLRSKRMDSDKEEAKINQNESSQQVKTREHLVKIANDTEKYLLKYKGRDPLRKWIQYLQWLNDKLPTERHRIISTLKKCTLSLQRCPDYLNDVRYIRLWIQYADMVSNPNDIFKYLYKNDIGEQVSLFYVGWAWVLESIGKYSYAHKVYLKAIKKKAQPQDFLQQKYADFQRRMEGRWISLSKPKKQSSAVNLCTESLNEWNAHAGGEKTVDEPREHYVRKDGGYVPNSKLVKMDTLSDSAKVGNATTLATDSTTERSKSIADTKTLCRSRRNAQRSQRQRSDKQDETQERPSVSNKTHSASYGTRTSFEEQRAMDRGKKLSAKAEDCYLTSLTKKQKVRAFGTTPTSASSTKKASQLSDDSKKIEVDTRIATNRSLQHNSSIVMLRHKAVARKHTESSVATRENKKEYVNRDAEFTQTSSRKSRKPLTTRDDIISKLNQPIPKTDSTPRAVRTATKPFGDQNEKEKYAALNIIAIQAKGKTRQRDCLKDDHQNPNCLDPYKRSHRQSIVENESVIRFLLDECENVHVHSGKMPLLPVGDTKHKRSKIAATIKISDAIIVEVTSLLGSGSFARVYSVTTNLNGVSQALALKYEKKTKYLPWEYFVVNQARAGKAFPEILTMYYSIQMFKIVEMLHRVDILHGDIKPDNWVFYSGRCSVGSSISQPDDPVHATGNIVLIDFGRAIDLKSYPKDTAFSGDCHVKGFQCVEMLTGKPWRHQIDTFGLCSTIHCMLFGSYMQVYQVKEESSTRWKIGKPFKRYWQIAIWGEIFGTLLNVSSCEKQPCLAALRNRLEMVLLSNPNHQQVLHPPSIIVNDSNDVA
uniref:Serine/threonine protein kinase putative n=1 Tax=Albugo laibachii Nc14 TaxID=890382 RepID=F0W2Q5_9STRA|nr:serine/threonine protein kinase putative [Albugo laibachii Nc14]|eukprot:CCA15341.1 serine/threonine protein kinase putative [Albugo laibachii Nc14]